MEIQRKGNKWVSSNASIPFGLKYDLISDSSYPLPISLGTATISWACTGSVCKDTDTLVHEEISFSNINFESGKVEIKSYNEIHHNYLR